MRVEYHSRSRTYKKLGKHWEDNSELEVKTKVAGFVFPWWYPGCQHNEGWDEANRRLQNAPVEKLVLWFYLTVAYTDLVKCILLLKNGLDGEGEG